MANRAPDIRSSASETIRSPLESKEGTTIIIEIEISHSERLDSCYGNSLHDNTEQVIGETKSMMLNHPASRVKFLARSLCPPYDWTNHSGTTLCKRQELVQRIGQGKAR